MGADNRGDNEMKKGIYVKIIKATLPAWYGKEIGKVFRVCKRPSRYCGGMAYRCLDVLGGILLKDCEVVEKPEHYEGER